MIAEAVSLARDLGNSPGNDINPSYLASTAQSLAETTSLTLPAPRTVGNAGIEHGLPAGRRAGQRAAAGLSSILEHAPRGAGGAPVVLVGKGLTFDSGGISIKPAGGM